MEFTLLGAAALGAAGLYGGLYWEGQGTGAGRDLWDTALIAVLAGLTVGRLAAMVLAGTNPIARPADIIVVRGGVDTVWASGTALVMLALLARREVLLVADALAAAALAGLAGWHAGCLLRDACLGTPSDLPWAFAVGGSDITRHPVELYTAGLLVLGAAVIIAWRRLRPPAAGVLAALALATAAAARWATEPLRPSFSLSLVPWYAAATAAAVLTMIVLATLGSRTPQKRP